MNSVRQQNNWIDGSLYPDQDVPERLDELGERIDFIARLCSAWDFGVLPLPESLKEVLKAEWKEAVAETKLLTSCAWHLLNERHGLAPQPYLGPQYPHILEDPCLVRI